MISNKVKAHNPDGSLREFDNFRELMARHSLIQKDWPIGDRPKGQPLYDDEIREIRTMKNIGYTHKQIAEKLGIVVSTVSKYT